MQIVDTKNIEETVAKRMWSVAEFCKRYRLDQAEETRLRKLLGDFASQHELLMNARRKASFA
ncbi:hypothetical protein [Pararhizobium arenae]|jgi:hypothetical protein|uniref:hypothetical protein n=1 Tax=Pararhizobium arenae TaxID=1856850 RepID=UPI00094AD91C|nr:hypothetical protein [Pararhizobium arenae]